MPLFILLQFFCLPEPNLLLVPGLSYLSLLGSYFSPQS